MPFTRRCLIVLVLAAGVFVAPGSRVDMQAQSAPSISPRVIAQISALMRDKATRSGTQRKLDSQLIYASRMARREAVAQGLASLEVNVPMSSSGRAIVDVRANVTAALLQRLRGQGATVLSAEPDLHAMRIEAPIDRVEELAADPDIEFVQPMQQAVTNRMERRADVQAEAGRDVPRMPESGKRRLDREALRRAILGKMRQQDSPVGNVGSAQSQGDVTHAANAVRTVTIDGTGVKIGVLSDGVTSLAASQATSDLGAVTVVPGQAGSGDEGTAMLEIIHDLAPGAQLYFATAFTSITSFANNIRTLRNTYGCDIIVDDVFYYAETPFQDGQAASSPTNGGVVTQAVKDVTAAGALYFSSAGNSGNLNDGTSGAWEGDFANGGDITISGYGTRPIHNFGGGQNFNVITSNGLRIVTLYWADPLGASSNDYDLFLLNSTGTAIVSSSTNVQEGSQDPYEALGFSSGVTNPRIIIVKWSGSDRFMHLSTNRGRLSIATAGEIHGHAATNAANAFGVAATPAAAGQGSTGPYPNPFNTGNKVETFSSDGPRRIFFDADGSAITPGNFSATGGMVLTKPDITAADGVAVTGAGGFSNPFFGTSASAPHAAAIAALVKSAKPSLTASQIRTALVSSAIDIEASGTDRDSGVGIIMANTAVQSVIGPVMSLDTPASGSSLVQPFNLSGWAIDSAAPIGTGVSAVHVWAYPSSGSPQFVGAASYGAPRGDIGSIYGSRFAGSGFNLTVSGLAPGTYTLVVAAYSTATSSFNQSASAVITIPSTIPAMNMESPGAGSTIAPSFTVSGWAVDRAASSGAGISAVHVYAFPNTGSGFGGGIFLGAATLGLARGDVGAVYGSQFNNAGFSVSVSGVALGNYRIIAYAQSSVTGTFNQSQSRDVTVGASPAMAIDTPTTGSRSQPFAVAGWAVDRAASTGTGVDAIHIYAFPLNNGVPGGGIFLGAAALGGNRGDVGAVFGSQFSTSGYSLNASGLTVGQQYIIGVYAHSTVTGTFNQSRFVTVTIQ